ncbi:type I secretion outer membrane, TolC family protein [Bordetella holmesii 70147]|nr:type I secretion outer membrane, TolC family protein [Bordetella holmesii 70147]
MRVRTVAAVLTLFCATATGASAQDLMQVWRDALARDPIYAAARAAYRANNEKLPQARAGLLPQLNAEAGGLYNEMRSTRSLSYDSSGGRGTWDLVPTQPLFDWSRWQRFEQSKLVVADAEVQLQQSLQGLLLRVADAYFGILRAQDALSATEAEKAAIAEQLAAAQRKFELGTATITDTYEAQARYDLVMAEELRLQNAVQNQRDVLAKIVGQAPGALAELPPTVALPAPVPARLSDWSQQAQDASLDVLRAQLQTRIAGHDIEIARSGHYPTLNLRASSGSASDGALRGPGPGRPIDNSVGVTLSIPLYAGGGVSSQVIEKVQLEQKARQDYETARRESLRAAREYFNGVITGLARVRALEAGEKSSRAAVQANQTGYELGVRINLDVLNAQQQLYATQRDLAQARYQTLLDGLRLKATSGMLVETDLDAINRLLRSPSP